MILNYMMFYKTKHSVEEMISKNTQDSISKSNQDLEKDGFDKKGPANEHQDQMKINC